VSSLKLVGKYGKSGTLDEAIKEEQKIFMPTREAKQPCEVNKKKTFSWKEANTATSPSTALTISCLSFFFFLFSF
jgi:hypothetical protein